MVKTMDRIKLIWETDRRSEKLAEERWNSIAKPLGSFGEFERIISRIAAVQGTPDIDISRRTVIVMCADNGVVAEGVSQSTQEVTKLCAEAIAGGTSNINILADTFNAEVIAVDIGMISEADSENILRKNVAHGTNNIYHGAAMTRKQAELCIQTGIDLVKAEKEKGTGIIVTGEMGIGNTTTAAAIACVLLGISPETAAGRGAGLTSAGLKRKAEVIDHAISVNAPDREDAVDILAKIGGFDIAGIAGIFLGGAIYQLPVVIDGLISAAGAAIAYKLAPKCREYMIASHISEEPAAKGLIEYLGLKAVINAGLRLGEGTGGVMLLPLLDGAAALYSRSHRFEDMGMERYKELK